MSALAGSMLTAALALLAALYLSMLNRFRERASIAAALLGEVSAYLELGQSASIVGNYRMIINAPDHSLDKILPSVVKPPTNNPVFDRVADKIGLLSPHDAQTLSKFYNIVAVNRALMIAMTEADLSDAAALNRLRRALQILADTIEAQLPEGLELCERLKSTSNQNFRSYFLEQLPFLADLLSDRFR